MGGKGTKQRQIERILPPHQLKVPDEGQVQWLEQELLRVNNAIRDDIYLGGSIEKDNRKGAVHISDDFLPVIAWIADERRAVFALTNARGDFPGFYTEDRNIIESLKGFAERIIIKPENL
jgi:hypothetical protein